MFITQAELKVLVHVCKNSTALCLKSGSHTHKKKPQVGHTMGSLPMLTARAPDSFTAKRHTHYCGSALRLYTEK